MGSMAHVHKIYSPIDGHSELYAARELNRPARLCFRSDTPDPGAARGQRPGIRPWSLALDADVLTCSIVHIVPMPVDRLPWSLP